MALLLLSSPFEVRHSAEALSYALERERDCVGVQTGIIDMRTRHQEMNTYASG